jgi:hypothetical protein
MPTYTDELAGIVQRTQEATSAAIQNWAESAKHYAEHVTVQNPLPSTENVYSAVDAWFDLAGKLVAEQHNFAKAFIAAGAEAAGTMTEQAKAAAAHVPTSPFTTPFTVDVPPAETEAPKRPRAPRSASA